MTGKIRVPIILVANKVDLHLERVISQQEGKELANLMGAQFVEVRSVFRKHPLTFLKIKFLFL